MHRNVKHHIFTYIDAIEQLDITLTDSSRSDDSEHISKILAACVALLKSLVNPPIVVENTTQSDKSDAIDGDSEPESTISPTLKED
jgi:hypothetical protein